MEANYLLSLVARVILAGVLLSAGLAKLFRISEFSTIVQGFIELQPRGARLVAVTLVATELVTGTAILFGLFLLQAAATASSLFVLFGVITGKALLQGKTHLSCGCFGPGAAAISWALVLRNVALASAAAVLIVEERWALIFLGVTLTTMTAAVLMKQLSRGPNGLERSVS